MSKKEDIAIDNIDFKRGPLKMFETLPEPKVDDYVLVVDDGGLFTTHPDRKEINGIYPHKGFADLTGKILRVLSISEHLNERCVIVLTDGKNSYWLSYNNERSKSNFKLT